MSYRIETPSGVFVGLLAGVSAATVYLVTPAGTIGVPRSTIQRASRA